MFLVLPAGPLWLSLLGCPTQDTPVTTSTTASTTTPVDSGTSTTTTTVPDPCPGCDDGLSCSVDTCELTGDYAGSCLWEPLNTCAWPSAALAMPVAGYPPLQVSLSGSVYDIAQDKLWVVRNSGPAAIWRLAPDDAGNFVLEGQWVDTQALDLEGITRVDPNPNIVHLVAENLGHIVSLDLSTPDVIAEVQRWDVSATLPTVGQLGAEGITFVPDRALLRWGFVDGDGEPYLSSVGGTGGLVFLAHQNGGRLYAYDLFADGTFVFVGTYATLRSEASGLEYDAATERLYIWHGNTNDLEIVRLSSREPMVGGLWRTMHTEYFLDYPGLDNLEGVAIGPGAAPSRHLFLITDDGGIASVRQYLDWPL